jgi:hypothetical protein
MRKKERERFVKTAKQLLLDLGAKQDDTAWYYFTLHTKVRPLHLHVTPNTTGGLGIDDVIRVQRPALHLHVTPNTTGGPGTVFGAM